MMHAFRLYTGCDEASHVAEGTVTLDRRTDVIAVHFEESPPHAALDWHDAPEQQYVISLSGTLEFTTRDGETFILRPGDVLVGTDDAGSGHKWRLIDDQPWRRCYVVLEPGAPDLFVAKA
ncbi:MAG TPA: cupin domain-containing protein [Xanthobacteraceae bacterium]|jgi:quercetin dioxygenase-like cupin family protein